MTITLSPLTIFGLGILVGIVLGAVLMMVTAYFYHKANSGSVDEGDNGPKGPNGVM